LWKLSKEYHPPQRQVRSNKAGYVGSCISHNLVHTKDKRSELPSPASSHTKEDTFGAIVQLTAIWLAKKERAISVCSPVEAQTTTILRAHVSLCVALKLAQLDLEKTSFL